MSLSGYIGRLLEKLGISEWDAMRLELKMVKFEEWILRHPVTSVYITFEPILDDKYHKYSASIEQLQMKHTSGMWQKHFTFFAKAQVEQEPSQS